MQTKDIEIRQANNGMFYAKFKGGGQVPKQLLGLWTRKQELEAKVNHYLSTRKPNTPAQRKAATVKKATTKRNTSPKKEENS